MCSKHGHDDSEKKIQNFGSKKKTRKMGTVCSVVFRQEIHTTRFKK